MPIYEYECPNCKRREEVTRKITDAEIKPNCSQRGCGEVMERVISASTSFILKGSGWAKDGYK